MSYVRKANITTADFLSAFNVLECIVKLQKAEIIGR